MNEMIQRLCEGNEEAFKAFFYQHKDAVYKYAILHLRDADVAADLVQEVFLKFWNRLNLMDPNQNVRSYLYTIARHLVFEELRKRIQFQNFTAYAIHQTADSANNIEETVDYNELENLYQEAINHLPEQRQKIFRLSKLEHLSLEEIAVLLNISKNTVRDQLVKGNKFIRGYIVSRSSVLPLALIFIDII